MITAIFDGNYLLHRCMRAGDLGKLHNRYGKPTGGVMGFLKSTQKTLRTYSITRCITVFDGGISSRRRFLYPEYKGAKYREPDDPLFLENDDPERALYHEEFAQQRRYLQLLLKLLGIYVVRLRDWEADDLCYRIAKYYNRQPGVVYLVSDDQDYFQAVYDWSTRHSDGAIDCGSLRLYRPIADELITEHNFSAIVGHRIEQHLLYRAIVGDGSDKIKGVAGVGGGWMRKIFEEYKGSTVYPFEDFFLFCMEHRTRTVRKISEQLDVVLRNYELMNLDLEPYPIEVEQQVTSILTEDLGVDLGEVRKFLVQLELSSILSQYAQWVIPFQRLTK
jgi:5'-3' exonuclease